MKVSVDQLLMAIERVTEDTAAKFSVTVCGQDLSMGAVGAHAHLYMLVDVLNEILMIDTYLDAREGAQSGMN